LPSKARLAIQDQRMIIKYFEFPAVPEDKYNIISQEVKCNHMDLANISLHVKQAKSNITSLWSLKNNQQCDSNSPVFTTSYHVSILIMNISQLMHCPPRIRLAIQDQRMIIKYFEFPAVPGAKTLEIGLRFMLRWAFSLECSEISKKEWHMDLLIQLSCSQFKRRGENDSWGWSMV